MPDARATRTGRPVPSSTSSASPTRRRVVAGFAIALALAASAYQLITYFTAGDAASGNGYSSLWFLAVLPAFLSAMICYIGDPKRTGESAIYWLVPPVLVGLVAIGSVYFLREGVICLIMM